MHIVWFKRDLRIEDHEALAQVAISGFTGENQRCIWQAYLPTMSRVFITAKSKCSQAQQG